MGTFSIWHWLIVLFVFLPYPILAAWLCHKARRRWWIWVILTLIPGVGTLAFIVLLTLSVGQALDRKAD